ncbi:MAG: hydrogenase maturation nickel metallochaperone HypA [Burkholderiaceae bacterium]
MLQLVEETARREGFARLLVLRLEAGQLAGVDGRALRFALESLAPDTLLDGARIELDEPRTGLVHGLRTDGGDLAAGDACPACGGFQLQPTGGLALRVVDMEVE